MDPVLPLLCDPESSYYLWQEKDGLLLGPYERNPKAHWLTPGDPVPEDFSFQLYQDDLERLEWYIEDACARVPLLGRAGITRVVNGPITYAPDGNGPMPGVPNAFEACVFTFGIVQGGGAGKTLAEWIIAGEPEWDMWSCDPRRFTGYADQAYANAKGLEIFTHVCDADLTLPWLHHQRYEIAGNSVGRSIRGSKTRCRCWMRCGGWCRPRLASARHVCNGQHAHRKSPSQLEDRFEH